MIPNPEIENRLSLTLLIPLYQEELREVNQVKRRIGTINRSVLGQLRDSLHRFAALRGTIITVGKFAAGVKIAAFEQGATPITLIDGEKLFDLLMKYEIGISMK